MASTDMTVDLEDAEAAYRRGDYKAAVRLLEPLANSGNSRAQSMLGAMYVDALGVRRDIGEARKWLELAVARADPDAEYYLAKTFDLSPGSTVDFVKAAELYRRSADKGHAGSQARLATMYLFGHGVPQDRVQSYMWAVLVGLAGSESALELFDGVKSVVTPAQSEEGQRLAEAWLAAHPNADPRNQRRSN